MVVLNMKVCHSKWRADSSESDALFASEPSVAWYMIFCSLLKCCFLFLTFPLKKKKQKPKPSPIAKALRTLRQVSWILKQFDSCLAMTYKRLVPQSMAIKTIDLIFCCFRLTKTLFERVGFLSVLAKTLCSKVRCNEMLSTRWRCFGQNSLYRKGTSRCPVVRWGRESHNTATAWLFFNMKALYAELLGDNQAVNFVRLLFISSQGVISSWYSMESLNGRRSISTEKKVERVIIRAGLILRPIYMQWRLFIVRWSLKVGVLSMNIGIVAKSLASAA